MLGFGVLLLPESAVVFDEGLEFLGFGEGDEVAGDEELLVETGGGVVDPRFFFVGAEDEADGRLLFVINDI